MNIPMLLGQSNYPKSYAPQILTAINRSQSRKGFCEKLPFEGADIWSAYEISWLSTPGVPQVAMGRFILPFDSPAIIESKSLKLYLNSLNNKEFSSPEAVKETLKQDLSTCAKAPC